MVDQTTHPPKCHSFVGLDRQIGSSPPALDLKRERTEGRKREKFYIYLDVTHTHPDRAGSTLKGQEEEKSGHTKGKRPKTAQGGRGTDGPPEPTYTAKRT